MLWSNLQNYFENEKVLKILWPVRVLQLKFYYSLIFYSVTPAPFCNLLVVKKEAGFYCLFMSVPIYCLTTFIGLLSLPLTQQELERGKKSEFVGVDFSRVC